MEHIWSYCLPELASEILLKPPNQISSLILCPAAPYSIVYPYFIPHIAYFSILSEKEPFLDLNNTTLKEYNEKLYESLSLRDVMASVIVYFSGDML